LILAKNLVVNIRALLKNLNANYNMFKLDEWDYYVKSKEYKSIVNYLTNECDMFDAYYKCMYDRVTALKNPNPKLKSNFFAVIEKGSDDNVEALCNEVLREYTEELLEALKKSKSADEARIYWLHLDQVADSIKLDECFSFEDSNNKQFNFGRYYEEVKSLELEKLSTRVKSKLKCI